MPSARARASLKPIVKHWSRSFPIARRARATTLLESRPPERKAPTGTSETSWRSTAWVRYLRTCTTASWAGQSTRSWSKGRS
jgi:hypothetical protein